MLKRLTLLSKISIVLLFLLMTFIFVLNITLIFELIEVTYMTSSMCFICMLLSIPFILIIIKDALKNQRLEAVKRNTIENILNESSLISKTDKEGTITHVNKLFCDSSGYKPHELLGKNHSMLSSGKHDINFWKKMYNATVDHKTIWNEIVTNKRKNGKTYTVDSWIMAEFDNKGNHIGFMAVRHNLTGLYESLEKLKNKEDEMTGIMNAINQSSATVEFCTNGFVIDANNKFLEMTGYPTLHEIQGKHHTIFMDEREYDNNNEYEMFWKSIKEGVIKYGEYMRIRKDGSIIWVAGTYTPIIDSKGKTVKILKIANDITGSINQKIELERKNSYLEHASKILRHDMHSGINTYIPRGISSFERRLIKFSEENDIHPEALEKMFEGPMKLLKGGLAHSQKVYNGVKEFTNLVKKESTMEIEKADLTHILKIYLKNTAYSSSVSISELGNEIVNVSLFCTAVDNLIRNGLKYNDSNTKLVKVYRKKENIIVEDNGRGMTKSEFEEYSKPYTRKRNNTESGSGLGLNICIAIMKEHGWKLNLLKARKGTKLEISLDK
jgi:PAS domain S-box-containing protein